MGKKLSQLEVEKIFEIRGFKLKDVYVNTKQKLLVICPKGHEFRPTLLNFRDKKSGCSHCARNRKRTQKEAQEIFNSAGYITKSQYYNGQTPISVLCPNGHTWEARLLDFMQGVRCPRCSGFKITQEEIEQYFKDQGYRLLSNYINAHSKLEIVCSKGHEFSITAHSFKNHGSRCTKCSNTGTSKPEQNILDIVKSLYPQALKLRDNGVDIKGKPYAKSFDIDIYIPELRKGIEFDGRYWHSKEGPRRSHPTWPKEEIDNYHEIKDGWFSSKGIKILHIEEQNWIDNKECCIEKLLSFLQDEMVKTDALN